MQAIGHLVGKAQMQMLLLPAPTPEYANSALFPTEIWFWRVIIHGSKYTNCSRAGSRLASHAEVTTLDPSIDLLEKICSALRRQYKRIAVPFLVTESYCSSQRTDLKHSIYRGKDGCLY